MARPIRHLLLVAFHFPPAATSSGVQRALAFARHFPAHDWRVTVLTVPADLHAPSAANESLPDSVRVLRTPAFDAARKFAFAGRYPALLALPDRWASWSWWGLAPALKALRADPPDLVLSTYPIASAHLLAARLASRLGVPLVADFRDPMIDATHPSGVLKRWAHRRVERRVARLCRIGLCTAASTLRHYAETYGPADKWRLVSNGFREDCFQDLRPAPRPDAGRCLLLHSGVIYPLERDPEPLFQALAALRQAGRIHPERFCLRLRASGHDALYRPRLAALGIADLVELAPGLPYREALAEMLSADGLLIMQASNCNAQVPAKLYEYLRARRPILALTDPAGDTAAELSGHACARIAALDDVAGLSLAIPAFLEALPSLADQVLSESELSRWSRADQCAALAEDLHRLLETDSS